MIQNDTICAIATAPGSAAIAVIRISGSQTFSIVSQIFKAANKNFSFETVKGNTIHFGQIIENETIVDEVLVSVYKTPHSYTSEDSVEISCHASSFRSEERR